MRNSSMTWLGLVAAIWIGLAAPVPGLEGAPDSSLGSCVRVPTDAAPLLAHLQLRPRVSLDYGTFRFLELGAGDLAALKASGVPFEIDEAGPVVRVAGSTRSRTVSPPFPRAWRGRRPRRVCG